MINLTNYKGTKLIHEINIDECGTIVSFKEGTSNGMKIQLIETSEPRYKVNKDDKETTQNFWVLMDKKDKAINVLEGQFKHLLGKL